VVWARRLQLRGQLRHWQRLPWENASRRECRRTAFPVIPRTRDR
jgi:hypothetical protein